MLEMVDEQNNQYYSQNNPSNQQQPAYGSADGVSGGGQTSPSQSNAGGYYGGSQQQPVNSGNQPQYQPQPQAQYQQPVNSGNQPQYQPQPQAQYQQPVNSGNQRQYQPPQAQQQPKPQNFTQQVDPNYQNQGFSNNPVSTSGHNTAPTQQSQESFQPTQNQSQPMSDYTNMFGIKGANTQSRSDQPNIWQPKTDASTTSSTATSQGQYLNSSYTGPSSASPGYNSFNNQAGSNTPNNNQRDNIQPHRPVKRKPKSGKKGVNSFISTFLILLIAPLLAFMLMQFVFQTYEVDGPSMENTLSSQDRLIVWKAPRTLAKIRGNDYIPKRGDILVFYSNDHGGSWSSERRQLIKRVVGLPGERVVVKNGQIKIYNPDNPDGFNPDLEDAQSKEILPATPTDNADINIPNDSLYFVGDNRTNSLDSRTFGPVPLENVVGRLVFRMMPVAEARGF